MSNRDRPAARSPDAIELLLRRALWRALSGSLITSVSLAPGCSSEEEQLGPSPGEPVLCPSYDNYPIQAAGLAPATTYDYLAVRTRYSLRSHADAGALPDSRVTVHGKVGRACSGATDETCAALVAQHDGPFDPKACGQEACQELSILTTRGDEVRRWVTLDEFRELVGTIDSTDDALLLVRGAGHYLHCNDATRTTVQETAEGYLVYITEDLARCSEPTLLRRHEVSVSRTGAITEKLVAEVTIDEHVCAGRAPQGLRSMSVQRGRSKLGDFLARCAHLEAASVFSFTRLSRELEAHDAPSELVARAREARCDEARHAATVGALARAHGGELVPVEVDSLHVRDLEEIALENAVEGCVRETYAALIAAHQAERAEDPALHRAMQTIARDEARHASLSHAVHAWLYPRLDTESRERVRRAQTRAMVELARALRAPADAELERAAGLPPPRVARCLLAELVDILARLDASPRPIAQC